MKMSCQFDRGATRVRSLVVKLATVVLLGAAGVSAVVGLTQPARVVAQVAEPAEAHPPVLPITSSPAVTYQTYLPLVTIAGKDSVFGVQMYGSLSPSTGFTRAVELGVGWVRLPFNWVEIEPVNTTPANYNWSGLDASVQAAQQANIKVILTLNANPSWAAANSIGPVTNTADLYEFMGAVVARYPSIRYWEIYNEPDQVQRFGTQGAVYATMLSNLYPVIKSANPSAQLVLGGIALDWFTEDGGPFVKNFLSDVLANCSGTCFDVANFHYYPAFRGTWENYGPDIIGKTNFVRQTLASYGFTRPVFVTELGWPAGLTWGSPELAARYVPKVYARGLAAGLGAAIWFSMLDADSSNPGLLDSITTPGTLIPRPAYSAYQTLTSLLGGATYEGVVPTFDPVEGYQFSAQGRRLDVYWYDCPLVRMPLPGGPQDCTNTKTHAIAATRVAVIDKFGVRVIKNDGDDGTVDGKVTLTIGTNPVYVDYTP
jgi:hypothetical protein